MNRPNTALYIDSLILHGKAPMRSHSDLMRTFNKGLAELVEGGVLVRRGDSWLCRSIVVAQEFTQPDSMNRPRKAVRFGTWLCLTMALKFTQPEVREILMGYLRRHPIYPTPTPRIT